MNRSVALAGFILCIFGIILLFSKPTLPENAVIAGVSRILPSNYAVAILIVAGTLIIVSIILPNSKRSLKMDLPFLGALQLFLASLATLWNALLPIRFEPLGIYGVVGIGTSAVMLAVWAASFILGRKS